LYDILSFDAEFGKILQELQILVERKRFLESSSDENKQIEELRLRGAPIEDLCLDFTLPGYPDYILKEGGENAVVSNGNLVP
jgi:E3 ubiquitin-protein ligase TRIP12